MKSQVFMNELADQFLASLLPHPTVLRSSDSIHSPSSCVPSVSEHRRSVSSVVDFSLKRFTFIYAVGYLFMDTKMWCILLERICLTLACLY